MPATSTVDKPLQFLMELMAIRQASLTYANSVLESAAERQVDIVNKLIDMELKMILSEQYEIFDKYNKELLRKSMSIVDNEKEDN